MDIPVWTVKITIHNGYFGDSDLKLPQDFKSLLAEGDPFIVAWNGGGLWPWRARVYEYRRYTVSYRAHDLYATWTKGSAVRQARRWVRRHYGDKDLVITLAKP